MAVVPGAGAMPFQQAAAQVFRCEYTTCIEDSPGQQIPVFQQPAEWGEEAGHAVNREHPDGRTCCQTVLMVFQ